MKQVRSPERLSKLIAYILARNPHEFGLVTDSDGYVKLKTFLKAVSEEDRWRYVRRSHLDEILVTIQNPPFEIRDNLIRATDRSHLPRHTPTDNPPKLLYTCVREKAYPVVLQKGIFPMGGLYVILSSDRDMAERIGKRFDQTPVVLTVNTFQSITKGAFFHLAGDYIYLAETIPPGCFTGPTLPKSKTESKKEAAPEAPTTYIPRGSFIIDPTGGPDLQKAREKRKRKEKIAREKAIKQRQRKKHETWRR